MVHMIKRVKKTKFQAGLSANERQSNVQEAFELVNQDLGRYRTNILFWLMICLQPGSTNKKLQAQVLLVAENLPLLQFVVAARVV